MVDPLNEDSAASPVVMEVLREATGGDRDLMQELAELYVSDADLQLRALEDAVSSNDMDRIKRIGHALKGSSLSIGANDAAKGFADLEVAAGEGASDRVKGIVENAWVEFERVKLALADLR